MKEQELRENAFCSLCGEKIGKAGSSFYIVKVQKYEFNLGAMKRQQGLGMMMGWNGLLAQIMGPNEDLADKDGDEIKKVVCLSCADEIKELLE